MAKNIRVNEGDWICSDSSCGNVNFSWRDKCNKCGRDKGKVDTFKKTGAEIGKQAASKSGGLFSAEDWQCAMCGNVNWARRNECNMCKSPKFAKIEARTGVGGGYCERDNVEYIEREASDDEIDEFGRKKKQFRLNKNGSTTNDNDNEESDDDDDDVDLSKYDLAASDEEEGTKEETHKFSSFKNNSTSDQKSTDSKHKISRSPDHRRRSRSPDYRRRSRSPDHRRRSRSPDHRYSKDRRRSGSGERRHRHDNERRERRRSRSPERRRRSYRSRS